MYHGAARDRGDKKRQRLTPPPNEMWMEVIMSKGKTPDGYIPASAVSTGGVATSSAAAWQGRARATQDWEATPQASMAQGSMQHQQYTTSGYQGRTVDSSAGYQGRTMNAGYQGRTMDGATGYQKRAMDGTTGYPGRAVNGATGYQGRMVASSTAYQGRTESSTGYQGRPTESSTAYQGRTTESSTGYQSRAMDGATGYQGRAMAAATGYPGRATDGAAAYQGRLVQSSVGFQGRAVDGSGSASGKLYQGKMKTSSSGKMAEDYKRERKLPPRVEEMLREQVNLDESVLHDAFAVAMEDLIPEREANFVAKGLCHLCGVSEKHFVPVVNFCPHADDNHSLCREHLRSVYRVRMEALFVGRNGSAPNRRLLRCLVCTSGCPCTGCTARKEKEVQKYKRYLLDTLRRNGQGSVPAAKDDRATTTAATTTAVAPVAEGRLTYGNTQSISGNDGRRYTQYPPTPPAEGRPPVQPDGFSVRSTKAEKAYEGRRQMQVQQSEYEQYPADERNSRDGHALSMQAQSKSPAQYPPAPKRAAKDTPADILSTMADSTQSADPRVARVASPQVHQGSVESPSAATVMNCAESEKSLVQLLSTLNQGAAPSSSMAMNASNQSTKDSSYRQSEPRFGTNGIAARNESSGNAQVSDAQGSDDTEMETSPRMYSGRGIADRRRQADDSPYQDQSSASSDRSSVGARSVEENQTRKRKASESDAEDIPPPRDSDGLSLSRDDSLVAAPRDESSAKEQNAEDKRQHQSGASPKLNAKPDDRDKHNLPKADTKENHSAPTLPPPPPPHRGPERPHKVHPDGTPATSTKKNPQERKPTPPVKRGRGRPRKHPLPVKHDDEETEDEVYREEDEEEDEDEDGGSESELDSNLDFCEVCQGAGDLVCCDKCPRSFHLKCLHMTENDLPEGDWQCDECKKPSRFDAYSTAVAAEHSLLDRCLKIVECLKSHPFSKPFLTPVENVPMYTRVVKQPMDLSKIEIKLKKGAYIVDSNTVASGVKELDCTHFANDIRLMWSNCKLFNDDGSGITRAADILSAGFERLYKESIAPPLTS